jgi:tRNA threonylcarbamoyladenosine biosynthesis protein TsaE
MKLLVTTSLQDLDQKLNSLFQHIQNGDIVLITGPVGAGKTTFVRHFVSSRSAELANSPSYNLIQEYPMQDYKIIHVDLYRIKDESDLESIGFWDALNQKNYIAFIEWPEMITLQDLPAQRLLHLDIQINPDRSDHRTYTLTLD